MSIQLVLFDENLEPGYLSFERVLFPDFDGVFHPDGCDEEGEGITDAMAKKLTERLITFCNNEIATQNQRKEFSMKSKQTPHTHTGITSTEMTVDFDMGGRIECQVTVPKGSACKKLDGGSQPWIVASYSFIENKRSILYDDLQNHGLRMPESNITDIKEVKMTPTPRRVRFAQKVSDYGL